MSNYGAIPSHQSESAYRSSRSSARTPRAPSLSPSHSQSGSVEVLTQTESNGQGVGTRNVRFVSPQGRGRSSSSKLGLEGDLKENTTEDSDVAVDMPESSTRAEAEQAQGRGVDGYNDDEGRGGHGQLLAWVAGLGDRLKPTFVLENSGSVARDHLASERTFLAYVRTSLAIASSGVALVQLFSISLAEGAKLNSHLQKFARPLGAIAVCIGILLLLIGSTRYFRVQRALISGKFPPARKTIVFISSVLTALVVVLFGVLIAVPRR